MLLVVFECAWFRFILLYVVVICCVLFYFALCCVLLEFARGCLILHMLFDVAIFVRIPSILLDLARLFFCLSLLYVGHVVVCFR